RAYAYAPTKITIFLASTATKAAIYLLLRFTFTVFDPSFDYIAIMLKYLIMGVAIVGMAFASFQAIFQSDVRRVLAYSSVAQVGYILLGIGIATSSGLAAGYLHLLNHAVIKGCLFISVGAFWYRFGITRVNDFSGLFKTMPLTMGAFTLGGLSLIGVPFTAGFVSKVKLILAAAEQDMWWAVLVIVFSSVLAIVYIGRIILFAYFGTPPKINGSILVKNEAPLMMLFPMWTLGLMSIAIGVNAFGIGDSFVSASEIAASVLLGERG
ncbi:MAG: proton-conducting transporter membrane subunit, partial [Hellea sp.]